MTFCVDGDSQIIPDAVAKKLKYRTAFSEGLESSGKSLREFFDLQSRLNLPSKLSGQNEGKVTHPKKPNYGDTDSTMINKRDQN